MSYPTYDEKENNKMKTESNMKEFTRNAVVEIEKTELESVAAAMRVSSGLQAGLIPCV